MDKEIPVAVQAKKRNKSIVIGLVAIVVFAVIIWGFRAFLIPTVKKSEITTALVEKGNIENTLNATGEVLPEFEEVLTSPVNASIRNVLLDAGAKITKGQSILTLDKSATQTEYEKQKFQLESKQNEINKLKLDLGKSFYDIKSNNDIKQLRIGSLSDAVENAKRLYNAGGGTRESIEQAELNLKVAQLEKQQLENEIRNKQQTMQLEIRESEIAASIQMNDLKELGRKLQLADIVATRDGVVTWVNKNIGATVRDGESLARIADLGSFKVTGSISDNYLSQLQSNMPAIIRLNDTLLRGHIATVYPSIQNNIVNFDVQLDDRHCRQLRPNMKVDVFLVTATHNQVLRVANGAAFKGASPQDIFVVSDGKATRRSVHTGLANFDYVELLDGVKAGDAVITSDMTDFKNATIITIKN